MAGGSEETGLRHWFIGCNLMRDPVLKTKEPNTCLKNDNRPGDWSLPFAHEHILPVDESTTWEVNPTPQLGAEIRLESRPQGAAFEGFSPEKMLVSNNTAAAQGSQGAGRRRPVAPVGSFAPTCSSSKLKY